MASWMSSGCMAVEISKALPTPLFLRFLLFGFGREALREEELELRLRVDPGVVGVAGGLCTGDTAPGVEGGGDVIPDPADIWW